MKRRSTTHGLPRSQQLQRLCERADTRQISSDDRYLEVYSQLLGSAQSLLPLDSQKLIFLAHAVFGWMPTQLRVTTATVEKSVQILTDLQTGKATITPADIALLATTFQTARGKSVVAASKILHFLAPERFPIWDRVVAKAWGLPPNGPRAAANYHGFIQACREFSADPEGQLACSTLRKNLATAGYTYSMTDMRIVELIFFLPP